jgi:membrane-associated protease RseP (regulator of RpoE activity)
MLSYVLYFLAALLLHEIGHVAAAYACNVTISEFGLGWGRKLFGFRVREVDYVIRLLPIGAYVRLDMTQLQQRTLGKQVLVLMAGIIVNLVAGSAASGSPFSAMNFLLAAVNVFPLYQQDGWKCGMVMLRAILGRKSSLVEWTFTIAGSGLSLVLVAAAVFRRL